MLTIKPETAQYVSILLDQVSAVRTRRQQKRSLIKHINDRKEFIN